MNWDTISAIGGLIGALAVVVSPIYVGCQLDHTIVLPIIESEEFAEIWLKGDHRLNGLSEANLQRLLIFERRTITLWHHNFQLRHQKSISDPTWYYQNQMIQFFGLREANRVA